MNKRKVPATILLALACMLCISAPAVSAEAPRTMDIPAGDLLTALETVARQAGVELLFQSDELKGLRTPGLAGTMTSQQAVERLLEGTGLQLSTDAVNGAMMIGPAGAANDPAGAKANSGDAAASSHEQQVKVTARRAELMVMRAEMVKLEDRFYSEYNRLNSNREWDVHCSRGPWIANRTRARICRPVFVSDAMSRGGGGSVTVTPGGWSDASHSMAQYTAIKPPPDTVIRQKWPDYENNMRKIIDSSPYLRELVREREALGERYRTARGQ